MRGLVVQKDKSLAIADNLSQPPVGKGEVLIRVEYASINPFDLEVISGKYDGLLRLAGVRKAVKSGLEFAGIVVEDGQFFKQGERVFGYVDMIKGWKAHAEYLAIDESYIARLPDSIPASEAAILPMSSLTAFIALQSILEKQSAQTVLINGASGGVGLYAVQIAKIYQAHVTAIGNPKQAALLQELGADTVLNYHEHELQHLSEPFDLIFDLANTLTYAKVQAHLKPTGIFIPAEPNRDWFGFLQALFHQQKSRYLMVTHGYSDKLTQIAQWLVEGRLKPILEGVYTLDDYALAFQKTAEKGRGGKVVLKF